MLVDTSLVLDSISRAKRAKFNPAKLSQQIGEGDRTARASTGQRQGRLVQLLAETGDAEQARETLERVLEGNDLVSINYLERGSNAARSVCRIRLRDGAGNTLGFGTGFLVAPGILMTNHHVIQDAGAAHAAWAEFDYELNVNGQEKQPAVFEIQTTLPRWRCSGSISASWRWQQPLSTRAAH